MIQQFSDAELLAEFEQAELRRRQFEVEDQARLAEMERRGIAWSAGYKSTVTLLIDRFRIAPAEATARVKAAGRLGPRFALNAEQLAPIYPAVSAAQASGQISAAHAKIIVDTIEKLPDEVAEFHDVEVENTLTEHALHLDPGRLAKAAKRLAYYYDQDGQLNEAAYRDKHRCFELHNRIDGSASVEGELTAECAEAVRVMIAAYGQPAPAEDGERDPRTATQRRHDALLLGLKSAMNAGAWPKSGGVTSTLILTMSDEAYATGRGTATTGHGYVIPAQLAKQWLGHDFRAIAVLMTSTREITAYRADSSGRRNTSMTEVFGGQTAHGEDGAWFGSRGSTAVGCGSGVARADAFAGSA